MIKKVNKLEKKDGEVFTIGKYSSLFESDNEGEWFVKLESFAKEIGFDLCLFAYLSSRTLPIENALIHTNYPEFWLNKYHLECYASLDPTIRHSLTSNMHVIWDQSSFSDPALIAIIEEASSFGLTSGVILPVHGSNSEFGMFNFSSSYLPKQDLLDHERGLISKLSLLRDYAFESFRSISNPGNKASNIKLTPRELEVLRWSMVGKSYWDISKIIKCSESTINFHAGNIRKKFNVSSKQQAVVKAIAMGLLIPE